MDSSVEVTIVVKKRKKINLEMGLEICRNKYSEDILSNIKLLGKRFLFFVTSFSSIHRLSWNQFVHPSARQKSGL